MVTRPTSYASVSFGVAAVALACAGCTLTLPGSSDAGATVEEAATTETVGQQCTAILTELCSQGINRCDLTSYTLTDCVSNDMPSCCATSCGNKSTNDESVVDECKAAFDAEDCNLIVNNTTPSACTVLVGQP